MSVGIAVVDVAREEAHDDLVQNRRYLVVECTRVRRVLGETIDFESLYRRADQALYQAKRGGRDRINTSESPALIR